jgi:Uma2 family endonuclease
MVAMVGASKVHVSVTRNLSALWMNYLRGTGCISYATDMKVCLPFLNLFFYPDLAVTCDDRDRVSAQDFILYPLNARYVRQSVIGNNPAIDAQCYPMFLPGLVL